MSVDTEFRVRYSETDQMGVVYHAEYLVWCEIGRTELIRRLGLSYAEMEAAGLKLAVTDASLRYLGAAKYDNLIRVHTTLSEVRSRGVTFEYEIFRAETGDKLVQARISLVAVDDDGRPTRIPTATRELLERGLG